MNEQFYTILTNIGKAKIANAISLGSEVNLVRFVIGDSNGSYYNPTEEQTELRRKVWETNAISVVNDEKNPNWIKIEAIIPGDVGGFTVREVGIFDDKNEMIAIGKIAEIYKPISENGSTKDVIIRIIIEVSNASVVTIKVDPTVMIATKKDIEVVESKFKKITGDKNELVTKNKSNLVAAINEVATDLNNIELTGNKVTIEDTDNNFTSGTVEGALKELATKDKALDKRIGNNKDEIDRLKLSVADGKSKIATSVSGKGVPTNGSDSFQQMADNIDSIKTKLPILEGDFGVTEDKEGNVFGVEVFENRQVYKEEPNPQLVWKVINKSYPQCCDSEGNIYCSLSASNSIIVLNTDGKVKNTYNRNNQGIAIDRYDNLYVFYNNTITKITKDNNELWVIDAPAKVFQITINSNDIIYVRTADGLLKISIDGSIIWNQKISGISYVAIDKENNPICIVNAYIAKFSQDGQQIWSVSNAYNDMLRNVVIDSKNSITFIATNYSSKYFFGRVSADGKLLWTSSTSENGAFRLIIDSYDTVYAIANRWIKRMILSRKEIAEDWNWEPSADKGLNQYNVVDNMGSIIGTRYEEIYKVKDNYTLEKVAVLKEGEVTE